MYQTVSFENRKGRLQRSNRWKRVGTVREKDIEYRLLPESGDLELLMRNKKMQARYDTWMVGMKEKYGSTGEFHLFSKYAGLPRYS